MPVETEVKIAFAGNAQQACELLGAAGYSITDPRVLEDDQIFDRAASELRNADRLLRLRRSGARSTVTYKGPGTRERYKSREEIEFEVSDASAFELVLDRLGYTPGFRYQKYRTKFADPPGVISIDETPIGVYLELEGPEAWIDSTALRLGFSPARYCTSSYAALYKAHRLTHPGAPPNMVFQESDAP